MYQKITGIEQSEIKHTTLKGLRNNPEETGIVCIKAVFVKGIVCGRCPLMARCQPCVRTFLIVDSLDEMKTDKPEYLALPGHFSGMKKGGYYNYYLFLKPGYKKVLNVIGNNPFIYRYIAWEYLGCGKNITGTVR